MCRLAISLTGSVAPWLTLPWIVCIVRSVTHYYGIHNMTTPQDRYLSIMSTDEICEQLDDMNYRVLNESDILEYRTLQDELVRRGINPITGEDI